jgi:hypothetical protein
LKLLEKIDQIMHFGFGVFAMKGYDNVFRA